MTMRTDMMLQPQEDGNISTNIMMNNVSESNTKCNSAQNIMNNTNVTKILGLNVCGLRSKLRNVIFEDYIKIFEILCLTETKLGKNTDIDFVGTSLNEYFCYTKEKIIKKHPHGGVHGICMFVKNNILKYSKLVSEVQSPYVLWVQFSEQAFGFSCVIGAVYLPNGDSKYEDKDMFDLIYEDIFYLKGVLDLPICLIGDMNSGTGNLDDTLAFEREIINNSETDFTETFFDLNYLDNNSIISKKRVNKDKTVDQNGRGLIDMCKRNNVIIINGRTGSDREIGDITFKSKNGSSAIDYCITSPDLIPHILDFQVDILDQNLSDKHSPIILTLKTKCDDHLLNQDNTSHMSDINYEKICSKWEDEKLSEFQLNFDQKKIDRLNQILDNIKRAGTDLLEINNIVNEVCGISITAGINTKL